jgi:hypothetical protein
MNLYPRSIRLTDEDLENIYILKKFTNQNKPTTIGIIRDQLKRGVEQAADPAAVHAARLEWRAKQVQSGLLVMKPKKGKVRT